MVTLREALAAAVPRLKAAGIDGARRDAEVLLCLALGCERSHLIGHQERKIETAGIETFEHLLARRLAREPMSQIAGEREFWSLDFKVTQATLTPRPDSETLIEAVLEMVPDRKIPHRILDLGTGTGCLLLALLSELPAATGVGVDLSVDSLVVAVSNAERLGLADRASFVISDWGRSLATPFDIVVANPPYIARSELARLDPEVARWEPRLALDGGEDGLDAYREILSDLARLMAFDGIAVLEHGVGQAETIEELADAHGFRMAQRRRDLGGHDRCLILKT